MPRLISAAWLVVAVAGAFCGLALAFSLMGHGPVSTVGAILQAAFGSWFGVSETLLRLVPILLCALAALIPAETGLINIGAEGQLQMGAIGAVGGAMLGSEGPSAMAPALMLGGGLVAAGVWGAIPGILRARLQVSEALVSLFLNYVAAHFVQYLVHGPWKDPLSRGWPMTPMLPSHLLVHPYGSSRIHAGVFVTLAAALLVLLLLRFTRGGFEMRVVGRNPVVAGNVGISVRAFLFGSMVVGGLLAGLAGYYEIAAVQHRLRPEVAVGLGYSGFLVAWMCRGRVWLTIPMALLVAGLVSGAENLQISTGLPAASSEIVQGLLLLFVLMGTPLSNRLERRRAVHRAMGTVDG